MSRHVVSSARADKEIEAAGQWWAQHRSAEQATRWVRGILKAIEGLANNAERHALALESNRFPFEVRQLLFGLGRQPTHRVLFTIRPECVYVLTVLHVAQDAVGLDDL